MWSKLCGDTKGVVILDLLEGPSDIILIIEAPFLNRLKDPISTMVIGDFSSISVVEESETTKPLDNIKKRNEDYRSAEKAETKVIR